MVRARGLDPPLDRGLDEAGDDVRRDGVGREQVPGQGARLGTNRGVDQIDP